MTNTTGSEISMFGGAKYGFVIPKNKLSGSLIQRGNKTTIEGSDTNSKKRKTKWGSDLTQDPTVKKARVLAYQKRLEQIKQKLESGTLEAAETNSDISEDLEVEKRQAIGEMLELNPRYKAPSDYKPLLKEAKLPINVDEECDMSFLRLIFSSQGDTQKRLEKETGAKVQIFGIKTGGGKAELSLSDESEIKKSWKELYFQISSETYQKVDSAIAVIELLMSSVCGNTGAGVDPPEDISTVSGNNYMTATDPSSQQPADSSVQLPQGHSHPDVPTHIKNQEQPTNSTNPDSLPQQPFQIPHNTSLPHGSEVPRPPDMFSSSLSTTSMAYTIVGSQIQSLGPHSSMRPSTLLTVPPVPRPTLFPPDISSSNMSQSVRTLAPNFNPRPVIHQPGTELPSSLSRKLIAEYGSDSSSLRPMSVPALRPFHRDFGFLPQPPHIPPMAFQSPSVTPLSQHFGQSFERSNHFGSGRQMDQLMNLPPLFQSNVRPSNLHTFGPPLPQMLPPRNFPGAQIPHHSTHCPPRPPVFHLDNLNPHGQPQMQHRFNPGVHQVYDPFSPSSDS